MHIRRRLVAILLVAVPFACGLVRPAAGTVVRYEFSLNNSHYGTVDVRLFNSVMPRSVTNFLRYVDANAWDGSFVHRRAGAESGVAVIQGGGYSLPSTGLITVIEGQAYLDYDDVPAFAPILDEPGGGVAGPSNVRGTIAMAKSGPDTVTSEWFFNKESNTVLDDPNDDSGGFAAFGRVLGNGMTVIDNMYNLARVRVGGPFTNLPVYDLARVQMQADVFNADVVLVTDIRRLNIPAGDYDFNGTVNTLDYNIWKSTFGSTTNAAADGNGNGRVDAADFAIWRDTLGNSSVPGGGSGEIGASGLPEPSSAVLAILSAWVLASASGRRRTR